MLLTAAMLPLLGGCRSEAVRPQPHQVEQAPTHDVRQQSAEPVRAEQPQAAGHEQELVDQSLVGRSVRVQFRRDALGMAGNVPIEPDAEQAGPRPITVGGTVRRVTNDWLVIDPDNRHEYYIPRGVVLMVDVLPK